MLKTVGSRAVEVLLGGIGGYGGLYVDALLAEGPARGVRLVAAFDPLAAQQPAAAQLAAAGVPCFDSLASALARHRPALVVLCTPIHLHAADSIRALAAGCHVLCEKPAAGSLAEAQAMAEAARRAGRFLAIGYQWSFSACIQRIKRRIRAGDFGSPRQFLTKVCWPRPWSYYTRNTWAGARAMPDGAPVNDSPVNNAAAHFLHNMLFLLGGSEGLVREIAQVESRVCRAYPIHNFDTAALRVETAAGVAASLYASHAVAEHLGPDIILEFEEGSIRYERVAGHFVWHGADGRVEDLGSPDEEGSLHKLWQCADAVRTGRSPALAIEDALPQVQVVEKVQAANPVIPCVPAAALVQQDLAGDDHQLVIRGLTESFNRAMELRRLPDSLF